VNRRSFLKRAAAGAAAVTWTQLAWSAPNDLERIRAEIEKRHEESVRRLQEWIHQPSIAAENRGVSEGCDLTIRLLREAGFDHATRVSTDGQPGIFATLDAGAPRTIGLYFMYDDPTSTPGDSALIRAQLSVYRRHGIDPLLWPRNAGSWPGYVFTGEPLRLPAGHFGLGHGSGAHAPDEYYVIESAEAKIQGIDGAVLSFVEYLFELAAVNRPAAAKVLPTSRRQ